MRTQGCQVSPCAGHWWINGMIFRPSLGSLIIFVQVHNALLNNIAITGGDFDNLATMFNDSTWTYENMRSYFKRIEHNLDFNKSNPDHGFDGWLKTSLSPSSIPAKPEFAGAAPTILHAPELIGIGPSRSPVARYNQHAGNVRAYRRRPKQCSQRCCRRCRISELHD
jgi:choline dehydrogenase-like flavoprotein